jgi:hypothetical protein
MSLIRFYLIQLKTYLELSFKSQVFTGKQLVGLDLTTMDKRKKKVESITSFMC